MFSVYPCVYREHIERNTFNYVDYGLSLCIQGTRKHTLAKSNVGQFIPVYTGNTSALYSATSTTGGLSLCIQGTRLIFIKINHAIRFIPVYTGNTYGFAHPDDRVTVYPCVYREHKIGQSKTLRQRGLSLCIQGTLLYFSSLLAQRRFIPVYTGNTFVI